MKRIIVLMLALIVIIASAMGLLSKKSPPESVPEPTPEPTLTPTAEPVPISEPTLTPEPAWEPGYCRLGDWGLLWMTFTRGDEVTVLGRWDNYYIVEGAEADLLVDMRFVRMDSEKAPDKAEGWTYSDTPVYRSGYLFGTPIVRLPLNTKVRIIDVKANWAYIEWHGGSGYVDPAHISNQYIVYAASGNGGTGGFTGPVGGVDSAPQDGSDVNMGDLALIIDRAPEFSLLGNYCGPEYETFSPCPAVILSDETEAYLCFLYRADELKVTKVGESECSILINGLIAKLSRWAVRLKTDEEYAPWLAYTESGAVAYTEYQRKNSLTTFGLNDRVWVIDELKELKLYVVEIDGVYGYMQTNSLSKTELITYVVPDNGGGGPSDGDSSGGASFGGGSGSSSGGWTPYNP